MIAVYIILALLAILAVLLLLRIKFDIICRDEIQVKLSILGIKIPIYPKNKKKVRISRFKKHYPREKEKVKKEATSKKNTSTEKKESATLGDKISVIVELLKILFSRFFRHLRLDVSEIVVTVGGTDAAQCAITYGIVSQSVAYLLEFLDSNVNISKKRKGRIDVLCDFTSQVTTYNIFISASLTAWQILDIGISLAYNYLKGKDVFNLFR